MSDLLGEVKQIEEGFASDAQRRAAFASGYKAKGKKGKKDKKEEVDESTKEYAKSMEKMADKAENVLGNLPFGKLELTKLLKAFPELSGKGNKATTQRRAFRKAFNQAAGQEIFEEGVQLDAEDQTLTRLRKLAGIS